MNRKNELDHIKDLKEILAYLAALGNEMFPNGDTYQDGHRMKAAVKRAQRKLNTIQKMIGHKK